MKSWKTTVTGILVLVGAIASAGVSILDGKSPDVEAVVGALIGLGFLAARDNDKRSEDIL